MSMSPERAHAITSLAVAATLVSAHAGVRVPHVNVPACGCGVAPPKLAFNKALPGQSTHDFPLTQVELCYSSSSLDFVLTAFNETSFFYNASQGTNDLIFEYEVMEVFISRGAIDPISYFEFEVNPNNVTLQTFIFNPSRRRTPGTPFDHFVVLDPFGDGIAATTRLDRPGQVWESTVRIPLGYFNLDDGDARGTTWRMNFFRTVTDPELFPNQTLGAWSPADVADFHVTPYFGRFTFV
ncbi:carbohydrate-binding domain, family 9-like, subgroup [Purpureocillium lavendulum]|uniref:Carbohydrate-binding domain, family 9-like, subgroup n=1 Tax=Purpureocillium lavendulum TaxID=1247861 RepID=A0AB34G322_9HYPO|nr:carbohydrate-binding domain, family 9-like, subgroup [Purpureocillium lavendulum]